MKNNKTVSIRLPAKVLKALKDLEVNISKACRETLEDIVKNKKTG